MSAMIEFRSGSLMYKNLVDEYFQSEYYDGGRWHDYLRSLLGVSKVDSSYSGIVIEFNSEQDKTWFLLRWS